MPLSDLSRNGLIQRSVYRAVPTEQFVMEDFGGGLDLNSDPERLDSRYVIQATNIDLSAGKARARRGLTLLTAPAQVFTYFYHSPVLGFFYAVADTNPGKVYRSADPDSGVWTDVSTGAPNLSAGSDCVEFNGVLVFATANGVYSFDGTSSWTLLNATVTGTSIAVWQNKLWVGGVGSRIWFSNAGSYSTWTTATDWVDIREGSGDAAVLGLHVTQTMDIQGRPSLLAGKRRSVHRINDPTTGAFSTISTQTGMYDKRAIASGGGRTCFISDDGIYMTDGASIPVVISTRVRPLFWPTDIGSASGSKPAPVFHNGQFYFSFPGWSTILGAHSIGVGACVHVIYDPQIDSFAVAQWPRFCLNDVTKGSVMAWLSVKSGTRAGSLYAGVNSLTEPLYKLDSHTDDAGNVNSAILQTPYLELAGGGKFRIHRLRIMARLFGLTSGTPFTLRVRKNGSATDSVVRTLTAPRSNAAEIQAYDFNRLGDCRSVSFVFELPIVATIFDYPPENQYIPSYSTSQIDRVAVEYTPTGRS